MFCFSSLNNSLWKCPVLGPDNSSLGVDSTWKTYSRDGSSDGISPVMFTTRQQEVEKNVKKTKGVV